MNTQKNAAAESSNPELGSRIAGALHTVGEKVQDSLGKVRDFAAQASEEIATRAASAKKSAVAAAEVAREKMVEGKDATVDALEELLVDARSMAHRVGDYIKANPGKSFAMAALVSWLTVRQIRKSGKSIRH